LQSEGAAAPPEDGHDAGVRALVLADTHLGADLTKLPVEVWAEVDAADVVLHAGDVVTHDLLDALGALAPVHAVLGNNDRELVGRLPDRLEIELGGVQVAMVHDSGTRAGRDRRMRRWFPHAQVVVFGHSHEPVDAAGVDGQRLFNPGSAVQRRRQPRRTIGLLELADGGVADHRIVPVS
jgi:putative phosphoesterase